MFGEDAFDLYWIDVLTARNEHVLSAIDNGHEPIGIPKSNVAGAQPAIRREGGIALFRSVPVTGRDMRPFDDDLASGPVLHLPALGIDDANGRGRSRLANGARMIGDQRWIKRHAKDRSSLGHSVAIHHGNATLQPPTDIGRRVRSAAGEKRSERPVFRLETIGVL